MKEDELTKLPAITIHGGEAGQTSAEYIAVTAVAVLIAIGVTWLTLSATLSEALNLVADELVAFTESIVP